MNVPTEGVTKLLPTKKVVSRIERSLAWMITVGKSGAEVRISCQRRLELQFAPNASFLVPNSRIYSDSKS
jgi:hypothetical protein